MRRSAAAELIVAVARQLDAAFEQRQRLVERQVAVLELLDDLLELGNGGFKVFDGLAHCGGFVSSTRHPSSPSASVTRTRSPGLTLADDRMIPVRASFQQSA